MKSIESENEEKVFGIGLSRTGTTSLAHALRKIGYSTAHWKVQGKIIGIEELYEFDAVTDTPVSCRFEQLYRAFPKSKFIYTTRRLKGWIKSIKNHHGYEVPRSAPTPSHQRRINNIKRSTESKHTYRNLLEAMYTYQSLYGRHESWKEAYKKHDENIKNFFKTRNEKRVLELNVIGEKKPYTKLCQFLDVEEPKSSFPHKNKGS
ncbi:sulfotransferase family protein [Salinibacter ruber]|uniref:sulfotransferase family protein n=1 Tax=Salinibacter ruber TaxID=146919 RepID=UPI00216770FA|nr:sulfotransferase family protein [Salinibacter ruber]MCS3824364.1 uncharacterized protein involved in tolerance to divalent cations [Salinibacter ruber]